MSYLRLSRLLIFTLLATCCAFATSGAAPKIDKVLILKKERKLLLLCGDKEVRSYRIALGGNPVGPKTSKGDNRTPEGFYTVDGRNAASQYHRSLHVSYPNAQDRARAQKLGKNPGGDIFIHGLPNGQGWIGQAHVLHDWTLGCIAVTNEEIEEIWTFVPNGTVVEIRP